MTRIDPLSWRILRSVRTRSQLPIHERELTFPALTRFDREHLEPRRDYDAIEFIGSDFDGEDASDGRFLECRILRCGIDGLSMQRTRIVDSLLADLHGARVDFTDSTWRDSHLSGGRLGAVTLIGATWGGVRIRGTRLGFVNLAGALLEDVVFEDCEIGTLDVRTARFASVAFVGCTIDELNVSGATLTNVDLSGATLRTLVGIESLRGATINYEQLLDLAPIFAAALGVDIRHHQSEIGMFEDESLVRVSS